MNIGEIRKEGNIYFVTIKPTFIQWLFGKKEYTERYKYDGDVFSNFDHIKAFIRSDGEIAKWDSEICKALNNFDRSF